MTPFAPRGCLQWVLLPPKGPFWGLDDAGIGQKGGITPCLPPFGELLSPFWAPYASFWPQQGVVGALVGPSTPLLSLDPADTCWFSTTSAPWRLVWPPKRERGGDDRDAPTPF